MRGMEFPKSEVSWEEFLRWLVGRSLSGADPVVSDNHAGLVKAIRSQLPGSSWRLVRHT